MIVAALTAVVALSVRDAVAQPAETAPLQLEAKIPLGNVRGRIDHMAVDLKRQRLFIAELWGTFEVAQAQQASCKVCGDQQRACMKNYAGPTCKSEYRMCMKSCGKKS